MIKNCYSCNKKLNKKEGIVRFYNNIRFSVCNDCADNHLRALEKREGLINNPFANIKLENVT